MTIAIAVATQPVTAWPPLITGHCSLKGAPWSQVAVFSNVCVRIPRSSDCSAKSVFQAERMVAFASLIF